MLKDEKEAERGFSENTYKMATKCACLTLHKSARIIGTLLFLITVGLFAAYLIFIEDLRRSVVEVSCLFHVLGGAGVVGILRFELGLI